jgi:hypothetical protein
MLLVGGGAALAASGDGQRGARCEARLARIAERQGVSVAELTSAVRARLLARIDAAEKAGKIAPERAAKLRERVANGTLCARRPHRAPVRMASFGMMRAAADFLGLDRKELRAQLPGNSLAELAAKQGRSASALEAAMLAPAKARLARAVATGATTQSRADSVLDRLEKLADRLAAKEFPKK